MVKPTVLGYLSCSAGGRVNSRTWDPGRIGETVEVRVYHTILPAAKLLNLPRFERDDKSEGAVSLIGEVKLCENWITSIAWSPWLVHDGGQCIYIFPLPLNDRRP